MEVVAVLGASSDSERYSYKAIEMLMDYGHRPIPIHPKENEILGFKVVHSINELIHSGEKIDTLTMYVNPKISSTLKDDILKLSPKRVIFNPGSENFELANSLEKHGIHVENACTLVMLRTSQF
ncbi:MAG: CoA-binding protein [Bacteriovoracaceae bacterium]